ncbi:MAG: NAD-dependent epimerase/dehydratase family protein [Candidatus Woesebacteria bacterium]
MKKFLITGAGGFIGSHLVDLLLSEGIRPGNMRLVIKPGETLDNLPNLPFEIIYADIRSKTKMFRAVKGCDVVYHLAARIDFDGKTYEEYRDINVDATAYLLAAAQKYGVKKFVFFSSIGVYGLPAGVGNIDGWDETHPYTYSNFYGQSKWEGEELVRKAHKKTGLPYAIVRPASVYGPREKGPTLALYRAMAHHQFLLIGNGENKMHYVFVKDLVFGARLAEQSKKTAGEYILAGPHPLSFREIVHDVAASIHVSPPTFSLPTYVALAFAYVFQFVTAISGIALPLFPSRVRTMTTTYWYKIEKAKTEIEYVPKTSFKKGSQITGAWYSKEGWL